MPRFNSALSLIRRSRMLLLTAAVLGVAGPGRASTFFPSPEELSRMPEQARAVARQNVERVSPRSRISTEPIRVDDMLFRPADLAKRSGFTGPEWTDGVVYYQFDSAVTETNRNKWRKAAADWSAVAKLTFVEGVGIGNYILVENSDANNSYIGMIGGAQIMNIVNWGAEFIIAHEIGHALGLKHEHTRSDRDTYVLVISANIEAGQEHNFDIDETVNFGGYDFDSVMHYDRNSFSISGADTLVPTASYMQNLDTMGQRSHLSYLDKAGMAARYGAAPPSPLLAKYLQQLRRLNQRLAILRKKPPGHARVVGIHRVQVKINAVKKLIRDL